MNYLLVVQVFVRIPGWSKFSAQRQIERLRILGETHIPAVVVGVSDEDAFIMSLAEVIARRGHRPLEILADIEILRKRGYDADTIIHKTGLSPKYVKDIVFLLDHGEDRLIEGAQWGAHLPARSRAPAQDGPQG